MKNRKKNAGLYAGAVCATMILTVPVVASAAPGANLKPGNLSMTFPTISDFNGSNAVTLTGEQQTLTATLGNWIVVDATGSGNGWHVTAQATQFTEVTPTSGFASGTSALTLPTGSLTLIGGRTITAHGGATLVDSINGPATPTYTNTTPLDGGHAVSILSAQKGYGMGSYSITENPNGLALNLNPSTTKVDTVNYPNSATPYATNITFSIVSGP